MNEQRTPDELTTENELICEKLLGWKRLGNAQGRTIWDCQNDRGDGHAGTPTFTTWHDAGLILDALSSCGVDPTLEYSDGKWDCYGGDPFESFIHAYRDTGPLAIRAAALEYIKAVKS